MHVMVVEGEPNVRTVLVELIRSEVYHRRCRDRGGSGGAVQRPWTEDGGD